MGIANNIRIKNIVKVKTITGVLFLMVLKFEDDKFLGVVQLDTSTENIKQIGHKELYPLDTAEISTVGEMVRIRNGEITNMNTNNVSLEEKNTETIVEGLGDTDKDSEEIPTGNPDLISPNGLTQVTSPEEDIEGEVAIEQGIDPTLMDNVV